MNRPGDVIKKPFTKVRIAKSLIFVLVSTFLTTVSSGPAYAAAPTISGLSITSSALSGGAIDTITGMNLTGATSVTVGGVSAVLGANTSTSLEFVIPAGTEGVQQVIVTTGGGSVTSSLSITYYQTLTPACGDGGFFTIQNNVVVSNSSCAGTAVIPSGVTRIHHLAFTGNTNRFSVDIPATVTAIGTSGQYSPFRDSYLTAITFQPNSQLTTITNGAFRAAPDLQYLKIPSSVTTIQSLAFSDYLSRNGIRWLEIPASVTSIDVSAPYGALRNEVPLTCIITPETSTARTLAGTFTKGNSTQTPVADPVFVTDVAQCPAPTVTSLTTSTGSSNGGTTVTITGTNLWNVDRVTIGGVTATITSRPSTTSITIRTPPSTVGTKNIVLNTPGPVLTPTQTFRYVPAPTISSLSVTSGVIVGGETLTITGTNLESTTSVTIGGTSATSLRSKTTTSITVTTPAGTVGVKDVRVVTSVDAVTAAAAFTYLAGSPTISTISPSSGFTTGGTLETITGTNLSGATSVTFGGETATIQSNTATTITVLLPTGTVGAKDVVVTTPGGSATSSGAFTYGLPLPTISTVTPNSGLISGGETVTVSGTNLSGVTSITIGGSSATSLRSNTSTSITFTTPTGTAGAKNVVITTSVDSVTAANSFTYTLPAPTFSSISPTSGVTTGGATGTITGTNLSDATSVTIGGETATIQSNTSTAITVLVPAGTAGAKSVAITTPGGTATGVSAFTYILPPPTISSISPSSGLSGGGETVTVTGTNLSGVTSVKIGGNSATSLRTNTSTSVTFTTPSGSLGARDVEVTTSVDSVTSVAGYTYVPITYSVTYAAGTGSGTPPVDANLRATGTGFALAGHGSLERSSFTFNGWHDGTSVYQASSNYVVGSANITLTAQWVQNSLAGLSMSSLTVLDHKVLAAGVGYPSTSFTLGGSTINYAIPANAFGAKTANTDVYIYAMSDTSTLASILPSDTSYILSTIVSWLASDGTVPDASIPLTMTVTSSTIQVGTVAYAITGNTISILGTATQAGSITISITVDPIVVLGNPSIRQQSAPQQGSSSTTSSASTIPEREKLTRATPPTTAIVASQLLILRVKGKAAEYFDSLPISSGNKAQAPNSTPSVGQLKSVAKGTYLNSEIARISSNLTATFNLPSGQVILSDYVVEELSTKAKVTFSEKGLSITPIGGFTGSIIVPSVAIIDGEEVIVLNKIIVNPVAPAAVGFAPVNFKRSAISWTPSTSQVSGYEIAVNGKIVCKTTKSSCPISALIGPNSKVTITAVGNEETSSDPVLIPYVARAPIPALNVNFATASAIISKLQNSEIRAVSNVIREQGFTKLEVIGFADSRGSKVLNDKLSQARAQAVADLMNKMLPKVSVTVAALGVSKPIANNANPKGQAQNRRTEISTW